EPTALEAIIIGNIGNIYFNQNEHSKAIENYKKAINIAEAINDKMNLGNWYDNLGSSLTQISKFDEGLDYHQKAKEIAAELGDIHLLCNTLLHICEIMLASGSPQSVLQY